ncbi:hypothetical protein DHEL01_v203098 [Diaporthe helianthi]|uniref:Uncharacterized protein n=1 Tax=Diaporthe helianthi TaxID=158607 RepID=A0A2P5I7N3_DIAHE|nr:hypothetical protein DHEL01_v203098 [Diaporthe helianthi]
MMLESWAQHMCSGRHLQKNAQEASPAPGTKPVATVDLLAVLDHYCDPSLPSLNQDASQLLIGLTAPDKVRAQANVAPETIQGTRLFAGFDLVLASEAVQGGGPLVAADEVAQRFARACSAADRTLGY